MTLLTSQDYLHKDQVEDWRMFEFLFAVVIMYLALALNDIFEMSIVWSVLLSRPFLGLKAKTETLDFRSRDQDRDLDKMNSSALESRDHGLEITTLCMI